MRVTSEVRFEAAHRLPNLPETHRCCRLHGHNYRVKVAVQGPLEPTLGWVVDFGMVDQIVGDIVAPLDHHYLNDIEGLENPTAEWIAAWIGKRLALTVLNQKPLHIEYVEVQEVDGKEVRWP